MEFCISLNYEDLDETVFGVYKALHFSEYVEVRLDRLSKKDREVLILVLSACFDKKKIIITFRNKRCGGFYKGSELSRLSFLRHALTLGLPYIDLEYDVNPYILNDFLRNRKNTKIILSYHNFKNTPDNLDQIFRKMKGKNPDIIKICTHAQSTEDNLKVLSLLKKESGNSRIITHTMGEKGVVSRIIGALKGNAYTYTSSAENLQTAPGQISIDKYKSIYFLDRLNKKSKIFGLIGNPVKHSFGYIIHNYAFNKLVMNSVYVNFPVENLESFITKFSDYYQGLSITIPYKEKIIPFLDYIDPIAEESKSVNTVVRKNKKLYGYNTDRIGIYKVLKKYAVLKNQVVVILGAGGSARSVLSELTHKSNKIFILNRNENRAENLATEFNCNYGRLNDISKIDYTLLINTTPLGMHPNIDESPVKTKDLRKSIVFDLIYNPFETKLLKDARQKRCTTISGFEMFLFQAEEQFYIFTEKRFPFNKYKDYFIKKIIDVNKDDKT
jgi:3-dehydroquinate dehydratase / shikimate dehydrogenase